MVMDLLSDALAMVRLTGALIYRVDIEGPWGISGHPTPDRFAPQLPRGTNQIAALHVVLEGTCWVRAPAGSWAALAPGQAVVIPHGDAHDLGDGPDRPLVRMDDVLDGRSQLELRRLRVHNGRGAATSILCGFLGCDCHAFEPLCDALPRMFVVTLGEHIRSIVHYASTDALDEQPGAANLRVRLAELLFTESLRTYMRTLPADATGWLAGLRDPLVGRSLRALHAAPCRAWTVEALAAAVASSRSALATRFRDLLGEAPMHYLTRLRMQLAARHLSEGRASVSSVAEAVGYDSSAAFQRAFKRRFGVPPATWRRAVTLAQVTSRPVRRRA